MDQKLDSYIRKMNLAEKKQLEELGGKPKSRSYPEFMAAYTYGSIKPTQPVRIT